MGWTSIYQLFWCSPGVQGFDTLPYNQWWSAWWFQHVSAIFFDVKNRRNGMITLQWWASIVQRFKKKTQIEVVQDLTKVVVYIIYIYIYILTYIGWCFFPCLFQFLPGQVPRNGPSNAENVPTVLRPELSVRGSITATGPQMKVATTAWKVVKDKFWWNQLQINYFFLWSFWENWGAVYSLGQRDVHNSHINDHSIS